jgi:hypothetical protein
MFFMNVYFKSDLGRNMRQMWSVLQTGYESLINVMLAVRFETIQHKSASGSRGPSRPGTKVFQG